MSWRDRAIELKPKEEKSSWRDRAIEADSPDAEAQAGRRAIETAPEPKETSDLYDYYVAGTRGLQFGARPFVSGVGAGIGGVIERLGRDDESGLLQKLAETPESFQKGFDFGKTEARQEEAELQERRPGLVLAGDVAGALATAPLLAARGVGAVAKGAEAATKATTIGGRAAALGKGLIQGSGEAARIGTGLGASRALGEADNAEDAAKMTLTGTATGLATQVGANAVGKLASATVRGAKTGLLKTASALTKASEQDLKTWASRADKVKELWNKAGQNISQMADDAREGIQKQIQTTRRGLNKTIGDALAEPKYQTVVVSGKEILKSLQDDLAKINPRTSQFQKAEIDGLQSVIDDTAAALDGNGNLDLRTLYDLTQRLQDVAKASYPGGQAIFPKGSIAARSAKNAASLGTKLVNETAPEIAKANKQLSILHRIEEQANRNMFIVGKPEASLLAAGAGDNSRNQGLLKRLDKITGGNATEMAENVSAARSFADAPLLPFDSTGKAAARMAFGGGIGYAVDGEQGGLIGAALTSPAAIGRLIQAARVPAPLVQKVMDNPQIQALAATPAGRALAMRMINDLVNEGQRVEGEGLVSKSRASSR
jgi:hypothetical protein